MQIHQTFFVGTAGYRSLDRPSFRALQSALFPPYFALQSAAPVALALTFPSNGVLPASVAGVLARGNELTVLAPLVTMAGMGLANAVFVGPWTTRVMLERVDQGTRVSIIFYACLILRRPEVTSFALGPSKLAPKLSG